jgi:hypothetical protein
MRYLTQTLIFFAVAFTALGQSPPPQCPSLSIVGPSDVLVPDVVSEFSVGLGNSKMPEGVSYSWGSSRGRFVKSYGAVAQLKPSRDDGGSNLNVFVEVKGLPASCPRYTSGIFPVMQVLLEEHPADSFSSYTRNELVARMDNFYTPINQEPNYKGLIAVYFGQNENLPEREKRIRDILDAIRFRKNDLSRVSIAVMAQPSGSETVLWIVRPGFVPTVFQKNEYTIYEAKNLNPRQAVESTFCRCK